METGSADCPRCGCRIRLTWTGGPEHLGHATLPDGPELVCLDVCDCEDGACPVTGEPAAVMVTRLARSGLAPERFHHARMLCCGCDAETEVEVLAGTRARCTVCGTINPWVMDELLGDVR
jgi:hypothetical protein